MDTYFAINLTNKKFQVGSTTDFTRRQKEHLKGKGDLEFQRSLRKNPDNFYWVVGSDNTEDRAEEQYYLDFYFGSQWCYNHNPNAESPPHPSGRTWVWPEEKKRGITGTGNHRYGVPTSSKQKQSTPRGSEHFAAKSVILTHPDGLEELFPTTRGAAIKYGLSATNLTQVAKGKRSQHKGFKLRYA